MTNGQELGMKASTVASSGMQEQWIAVGVDVNGEIIYEQDTEGKYSHLMQNDASIVGAAPGSNQLKDAENELVESKKDKIVEIFKASTECHDILQAAQKESYLESYNLD